MGKPRWSYPSTPTLSKQKQSVKFDSKRIKLSHHFDFNINLDNLANGILQDAMYGRKMLHAVLRPISEETPSSPSLHAEVLLAACFLHWLAVANLNQEMHPFFETLTRLPKHVQYNALK